MRCIATKNKTFSNFLIIIKTVMNFLSKKPDFLIGLVKTDMLQSTKGSPYLKK